MISWVWLLFNLGVGKRSLVHCTLLRTLKLITMWGSAPGRRAVGSAGRRKAAGWGIEELFISYSD